MSGVALQAFINQSLQLGTTCEGSCMPCLSATICYIWPLPGMMLIHFCTCNLLHALGGSVFVPTFGRYQHGNTHTLLAAVLTGSRRCWLTTMSHALLYLPTCLGTHATHQQDAHLCRQGGHCNPWATYHTLPVAALSVPLVPCY